MIVELIGAPGVGKTTLARKLSERLKKRQIPVELWLSYRPAEALNREGVTLEAAPYGPSAVVRRVARPAYEMLKVASSTFGHSPDAAISQKLIDILKPAGVLTPALLRQYLRRLSFAWLSAAQASRITLFDQGFAQAICSLAIVSSNRSEWHIENALRETPAAHLFIRLTASDDVITKRLRARERRQSRLERLLERDLDTNLRMARVVDAVYEGLLRLGRPTISVETHNYTALDHALALLDSEITELYQNLPPNGLSRAALGGRTSTSSP
jgi:GTPase SAR1 family protein